MCESVRSYASEVEPCWRVAMVNITQQVLETSEGSASSNRTTRRFRARDLMFCVNDRAFDTVGFRISLRRFRSHITFCTHPISLLPLIADALISQPCVVPDLLTHRILTVPGQTNCPP